MKVKNPKNSTTLSTHYWKEKEEGRDPNVKIFADQDLGITIEINLKRVNFLDVTLDLESGVYKPYRKTGERPL